MRVSCTTALTDLLAATGGHLVAPSIPVPEAFHGVALDSRRVEPGDLFWALAGASVHGSAFADQAIAGGAVAVVSDRRIGSLSVPEIFVPDALQALHRFSRWFCGAHLSGMTRIGITGSSGKTTTKELVAAALAPRAPVYRSSGNLNSETGVPLAVLGADRRASFGVFEMAMSAPGEMRPLADVVRPSVAAITGIGTAHIEFLGSREAIAAEKRDIAAAFDGTQTLIVREDDPLRPILEHGVAGTVVPFGPSASGIAIGDDGTGRVRLRDRDRVYTLHLRGAHNGWNALAALAVAERLGVERGDALEAMTTVTSIVGRGQVRTLSHQVRLLDDAYNANPESMVAFFGMVEAMRESDERVIIVLGDMAELGGVAAEAHRETLRRALDVEDSHIIAVGPSFGRAAADAPMPRVERVEDSEEAAARCAALLTDRAGRWLIALKGSRAAHLERVANQIAAEVAC